MQNLFGMFKENAILLQAYEEEICKLKKERTELQAMLDRFERHMREIQSSVKLLTNERDKTQQLYEQVNNMNLILHQIFLQSLLFSEIW